MAAQPVVTGRFRPFIVAYEKPKVTNLPFVRRQRGKTAFWSPARTGRDLEDARLGHYYAVEYLQFLLAAGAGCWLSVIVESMPRRHGALEISFLAAIEQAALCGARVIAHSEVQS